MLPYGPIREAALKKARATDAYAHMEDWLNSPGLMPPKKYDTPVVARSHVSGLSVRHYMMTAGLDKFRESRPYQLVGIGIPLRR